MLKTKTIKGYMVSAAILLICSFTTQAHTSVFGTTNAGVPGSVNFWMGSYHGSNSAQGSLTINGSTTAFTTAVSTADGVLPDPNLIFGTNLFWAQTFNRGAGYASSTGAYNSTTPVESSQSQLVRWQTVLVTGLAAGGTYVYQISGMTGINWADWNTNNAANWTGSLFVPNSSVNNVPAPSTLLLFGLGLLGAVFTRRKLKK